MKQFVNGAMLAVSAFAVCSSALAVSYTELVPWSTLQAGGDGTSHFGAVVDGSTSYHQLRSGASITKVTDLGGAQTSSVLMDATAWFNATGETSMSTWYGFGVSGNYLQFAETTTDAVWRVDTTTGAVSAYVTEGDITTLTGLTSAQSLSPSDTGPSGEIAFYEGQSDSILISTGQNNVDYLLTSADLTTATGNDSVSGGISYDVAGNLYWGSNGSDDMWVRESNGTINQVLTTAEILAVSGSTSVSWKDIFAAPDGLVYFQETSSDHIMRFDPIDAVNSLEIYISKTDLQNGPMGSDNAISLTWYDGNLAWHTFNDSGLYVVPEPTSLLLCALAGMFIRRR